jgi:hypothetical protein
VMSATKKKRIVDVKESTRKPTGEYESSLNPHTSGIDPSFWHFLCVRTSSTTTTISAKGQARKILGFLFHLMVHPPDDS